MGKAWVLTTTVFSLMMIGKNAFGQAPVAPYSAQISNVTHAGSGCPPGSIALKVSPDGQRLHMFLDQFVAEKPAGMSIARTSCQVSMILLAEPGYQFALENDGNFFFYYFLDRNVSASLGLEYFFPLTGGRPTFRTTFFGPADRTALLSDSMVFAPVWSPCGLNLPLTIKLEARVQKTNTDGVIQYGFLGLNSLNSLKLNWRPCQ